MKIFLTFFYPTWPVFTEVSGKGLEMQVRQYCEDVKWCISGDNGGLTKGFFSYKDTKCLRVKIKTT